MDEDWLPIKDFPDYEISNLGRVRSWRGNGTGRSKAPKILKPQPGTNGYLKQQLCNAPGTSQTKYIHRLVAEHFIGPCPQDYEVSHRDGDSANNVVSNLEYATHSENIARKNVHGTLLKGSAVGSSKLTEDSVHQIREEYAAGGVTQRQLADRYGVSNQAINLIILNRVWRHV